jgi:hypothetical protein
MIPAILAAALVVSNTVQTPVVSPSIPSPLVMQTTFRTAAPDARISIFRAPSGARLERSAPAVQSPPHRHYTNARRAAALLAGAAGGFVAGGFIGYHLDRLHACGCDDPGLKGFVVGSWIGAAAGVIAAGYVTR